MNIFGKKKRKIVQLEQENSMLKHEVSGLQQQLEKEKLTPEDRKVLDMLMIQEEKRVCTPPCYFDDVRKAQRNDRILKTLYKLLGR